MSRYDARHPSDPGRDGRGGRTGAARIGRQRGLAPQPEPEPPVDLNEFAELQATEALLDRLGRRDLGDDDLADPLAALLAGLTQDVDLETDASRRFRAVLAGRTAQDGQWRFEPPSTGPIPEIPGRAAAHRRDADHPGGFVRQVVRAVPVMGAAAGVLLAVAGGVVAAVTGDPMAPIAGINSALNAPQSVSYEQVHQKIQNAALAASTGDSRLAKQIIDQAKDDLERVSAPQQSAELDQQIADVEQSLGTTSSTAAATPSVGRTPDGTPPVSSPAGTASGTETPTDPATSTADPTETSTPAPTDTGEATSSPTPSTVPSTPPAP